MCAFARIIVCVRVGVRLRTSVRVCCIPDLLVKRMKICYRWARGEDAQYVLLDFSSNALRLLSVGRLCLQQSATTHLVADAGVVTVAIGVAQPAICREHATRVATSLFNDTHHIDCQRCLPSYK